MNERDCETAQRMRATLEGGGADAASFRAALTGVAALDRDAWLDLAFGLGPLPDDGPDLPPGCVPYLPCLVDPLLRMIDLAEIGATDRVVDIGSGAGRAAALIRLLSGAAVAGIEIQRSLVDHARELAARLRLDRISFINADAAHLPDAARDGTVFLLNCPFSGQRFAQLLDNLEPVARAHTIRLCCVDLPLPSCGWLTPIVPPAADLAVYRST